MKEDLSNYTTKELYQLFYIIQWEIMKRQWWVVLVIIVIVMGVNR